MSDYSAQLTALRTALASGELTVEAGGRRVTYRSTDDLVKAIGHFEALEVKAAQGARPRYGVTLATFGAG